MSPSIIEGHHLWHNTEWLPDTLWCCHSPAPTPMTAPCRQERLSPAQLWVRGWQKINLQYSARQVSWLREPFRLNQNLVKGWKYTQTDSFQHEFMRLQLCYSSLKGYHECALHALFSGCTAVHTDVWLPTPPSSQLISENKACGNPLPEVEKKIASHFMHGGWALAFSAQEVKEHATVHREGGSLTEGSPLLSLPVFANHLSVEKSSCPCRRKAGGWGTVSKQLACRGTGKQPLSCALWLTLFQGKNTMWYLSHVILL